MSDIKKRAERNGKVRRTIARIEQTIRKLESMKSEYMKKAVDAKARGESASYSLAKSGLNATITQEKRAKEMLLNIRITAELQKMGETNADFLTGMSVIAKRISKINRQSDFVKLQKEIEKALSGMEEAQAGLDGFLQNTDAQFAAISSAPGALSDADIDRLVDGKVSEKELVMDEQIEALIKGRTPMTSVAPEQLRADVSVGSGSETAVKTDSFAPPFPSPKGYFDFSCSEMRQAPMSALGFGDGSSLTLYDAMTRAGDLFEPSIVLTDAAGTPTVLPLSVVSNVLVTGGLGSGKSKFIHSIILAALCSSAADRTKLLTVDLERDELCRYDGIPQAAANAVTDVSGGLAAIKALKDELEMRYALFASAGVRDIVGYNAKAEKRLPYIVCLIDEFSPLSAASFEAEYLSLARQCGAVGIYTVLATREDAFVTPGIRSAARATVAFGELDGEGRHGCALVTVDGDAVEYRIPRVPDESVSAVLRALKETV